MYIINRIIFIIIPVKYPVIICVNNNIIIYNPIIIGVRMWDALCVGVFPKCCKLALQFKSYNKEPVFYLMLLKLNLFKFKNICQKINYIS